MPDCEWLMLLTMNCQTTGDPHRKQQISEKPSKISSKQDFYYRSNHRNTMLQVLKQTIMGHHEFGNISTCIGFFKGIILLKVKEDAKPHQALPRCIAYAVQKPLMEELLRLHKQDILGPLRVDEMAE